MSRSVSRAASPCPASACVSMCAHTVSRSVSRAASPCPASACVSMCARPYPHVFALCTRITSLVFNCSQCPGDRQRLRDLPQRPTDGAMGPTKNSHSVQCFLHCWLDHSCLRDQPRHHPYCKSNGRLLMRNYCLANTGLFFYTVIFPSALPSIRHSTKLH